MPDLGRYAVEVLMAYAGSGLLIGGLVLLTLTRAARVRRALEDAEKRMRNG